MSRSYQNLSNISDEQIRKAFDLRKRGLTAERISPVTGITQHSLTSWFAHPPQKLTNRIMKSDLLRDLVKDHPNLRKVTVVADELSDEQRANIPVIDRRGTSTGYASRHAIDEESKLAKELNSLSPISVYATETPSYGQIVYQENPVEKKLELTSQQITASNEESKVFPFEFEVDTKNMVDLNTKLINYKKVIEGHLESVNALLTNLDTLSYIETLEDAETGYRDRIEKLEQEVLRLQTVERRL